MIENYSKDACSSNGLIFNKLCPFIHSSKASRDEYFVEIGFARMAVEAPVKETKTTTTTTTTTTIRQPNDTSIKRLRTARKTNCINPAQNMDSIVQQAPRSYSCCPSKIKCSGPIYSMQVSPATPRLPLANLTKCRSPTSTSSSRKAVLPKRKLIPDSSYAKRFCRSFAENNLIGRRGVPFESNEGADYTRSNPGGRKTTAVVPEINNIHSAIIFRQLNVLKQGGYWKHLPRCGTNEGELSRNQEIPSEQIQYSIRKMEKKENLPPSEHPNTRISYSSHTRLENEDGDVEDDWELQHDLFENPYIGSAFGSSRRGLMLGESHGFCVHAITEDGWMCGSEAFRENGNHYEQHLLLLHLPRKVAALGRQGMCIWGIDLMRRRENGALEPHSFNENNGHDNNNGFQGDLLFGRISMQ